MPLARPIERVGETPLVEFTRLRPKPGVLVYARIEGQNPSGGAKGRGARCPRAISAAAAAAPLDLDEIRWW